MQQSRKVTTVPHTINVWSHYKHYFLTAVHSTFHTFFVENMIDFYTNRQGVKCWIHYNLNTFFSCRHSLDGLYNNLHRINDDLALKNNSLDLDNKCMDVRKKLETRPQTCMQRNLTLTGIERERSKVLA